MHEEDHNLEHLGAPERTLGGSKLGAPDIAQQGLVHKPSLGHNEEPQH